MSLSAILEKHRGEFTRLRPTQKNMTPRMRQVLTLICDDYTNSAIALTLNTSIKTVEHHRAKLSKFSNTNSPISLYKWALSKGYTEMPVDSPARQ